MYLLKLFLFAACLTYALGQFSLLSVPKPNRNSAKERRINSPNTVIHIKVGPKATFRNESISFLSTAKPIPETSPPSSLAKRSTESVSEQNDEPSGNFAESGDKSRDSGENLSESPLNGQGESAGLPPSSTRTPKYGFGSISSFGDKLKPSLPSFESKAKPGFSSLGDKFKPPAVASEFGKLANETANRFKDIPIISDFLKIPSYFKVNSLKSAIDYMVKYGHLESLIDVSKPQDLANLKDAFKDFQNFFGLKATGLFDQATLDLMNEKRCGLPDKDTKFTKLVQNLSGGLIRKKRFELYSAKYDQRNLTWSLNSFPTKALRNQNEQVLEVFQKAFELWQKETNLNFEFKPNTNTTDIVIGFYSKQHGGKWEPSFDGENGTLAHTSFPFDQDLHIDSDERWSLYPQPGYTDLFTVAIHEIGHKLGLKHSRVQSACLYPIYNAKRSQLDPDDIEGIQSLYGAKHNNDTESEFSDKSATEKPESEEDTGDDSQPGEGRPGENRPEESRPDENRPEESRPDENRPEESRPNDNRPGDTPAEERPTEANQAIRISEFNPKRNIFNRREYQELISTPCNQLNIDSSVCLRNNKCLVIAGDQSFWMNGRLRLMRRKKERTDVLFKGLQGKIDSAYRDGDLLHIIQGNNVTTYDAFYSEPIARTTLDEHFPGLPNFVKGKIDSVFKKMGNGVIYIYSGDLYWRFRKGYGLERIPRPNFIWGLPGKIKSVLHFNNGKSIYIKKNLFWIFDESTNNLLSLAPGNIAELNLCKPDRFGFLPFN